MKKNMQNNIQNKTKIMAFILIFALIITVLPQNNYFNTVKAKAAQTQSTQEYTYYKLGTKSGGTTEYYIKYKANQTLYYGQPAKFYVVSKDNGNETQMDESTYYNTVSRVKWYKNTVSDDNLMYSGSDWYLDYYRQTSTSSPIQYTSADYVEMTESYVAVIDGISSSIVKASDTLQFNMNITWKTLTVNEYVGNSRNACYGDSSTLIAPEISNEGDSSYDFEYVWYQYYEDEGIWHPFSYPDSPVMSTRINFRGSKKYKCEIAIQYGDTYYYYYDSAEYTITCIDSAPMSSAEDQMVYIKYGQSGTLNPDVNADSGYSVQYEWRKLDDEDSDAKVLSTDSAYTISDFSEDSAGTYTCNAILIKDGAVYYNRLITFMVYEESPFTINDDAYSWLNDGYNIQRNTDYNYGISDTFDVTLDVTPDAGYTLDYQWYTAKGIYSFTYTAIDGENTNTYKHTLAAEDFCNAYNQGNSKLIYACKVTATSSEHVYSTYILCSIKEKTGFSLDITSATSPTTHYVSEGDSLTLKAPDISCRSMYVVNGWWEHYDTTTSSYVKLSVDPSTTYSIDNVSSESYGKYRYYYEVHPKDVAEAQDYVSYKYSFGQVVLTNTTGLLVKANLDSVKSYVGQNLYLKAETTVGSTDYYNVSYVWKKDGTIIDNSVTDTYEKTLNADDFGTYTCTVTATSKSDVSVTSTQTVQFTVEEVTNLQVTSPDATYIYVYNKNLGDTIKFDVQASNANESVYPITYTWTRYEKDSYSDGYHTYNSLDTQASSYQQTISDNYDYTTYRCVVSDGVETATLYFMVKDNSTFYAKNVTSATEYKKVGDSLTMKVRAYSDKTDVTFAYQWYTNEGYVLGNGTSDTYKFDSLEEKDFRTYYCIVTNERTGDTQKVYFYINEYSDLQFTEITNTDTSSTYSIGESIKLGVTVKNPDNYNLTYKWSFSQYYVSDDGVPGYADVKALDDDGAVCERTLNEGMFGIYYLKVYCGDETTTDPVYTSGYKITQGVSLYTETLSSISEYIYPGSSTTFKVYAHSDSGEEIKYQWYTGYSSSYKYDPLGNRYYYYEYDGIVYGANSSSLEVIKHGSDIESYYCVVTCGKSIKILSFNLYEKTGSVTVEWDADVSGAYKIKKVSRKLGESVNFNISATSGSDRALTYRWYQKTTGMNSEKRMTQLSESTTSYSISSIDADDYGYYYCYVYYGSGYSEYVKLLFNLTQKNVLTASNDTERTVSKVDVGGSAVLVVKASVTDSQTLSYQWYKYSNSRQDYVAIDNATADAYVPGPMTADDFKYNYMYKCVVTAAGESVTVKYSITENDPFTLKINVSKDYAVTGDSVSFSADVTNHLGTDVSYQWYTYDEDNNMIKIKDATDVTLTRKVSNNYSVSEDGMIGSMRCGCRITTGAEETAYKAYAYGTVKVFMEEHELVGVPSARAASGSSIIKYGVQGATSMTLHFDSSKLIPNYNNTDATDSFTSASVVIVDNNGKATSYLGNRLSGKDIVIAGDSCYIYMNAYSYVRAVESGILTDSDKYGYRVQKVDYVDSTGNTVTTGPGITSDTSDNTDGPSAVTSGSATAIKVINKKVTIGVKEKLDVAVKGATYKTSQKKTATVSKKGIIQGKKKGKIKITVKTKSKKIVYTITVKPAPKKIKKLKGIKKKIQVKKSFTIKVVLPKGTASHKITFKSSNKKILKVSKKGKVTARKKGKATITVKTFNGKKKTIKIKVF